MPDSVEEFAAGLDRIVENPEFRAANGEPDPLAVAVFSEPVVKQALVGFTAGIAGLRGVDDWSVDEKELAVPAKVYTLFLQHRVKIDPARMLDYGVLLFTGLWMARGFRGEIRRAIEERKKAEAAKKDPAADVVAPAKSDAPSA